MFIRTLLRGLDWLSTIVTMAPLLGLLGTVTGMIGAFQVFGADGGGATAITGGVGEASSQQLPVFV